MTLIDDDRRVRKRGLEFDGRYGPIGRLQLFVLKLRANAMLRRTLRPKRGSFSSAAIPAYLRQDIGLPPEMSKFDHWRYR